MRSGKRFLTLLLVAVMIILSLTACGKGKGKKYIGISMPTQSSERWIKDGATMKEILEKKGYKVDLQYAEDDIPTQKSQIENMITKGADVLVIAAVNGNGKITAKSKGSAVVTLTTYNGISASYNVTVKGAPKSVQLSAKSNTISIGKKLALITKLSPNSASYRCIYISSNKNVATVNSKGVVTAKKTGSVFITVNTFNGKTAKIKLTIKK